MFQALQQSDSNITEREVEQILDVISKRESGNEALEILSIISYFAPENIDTEIFLNLVSNKEGLKAAIKLLKQCSIVDSDQNNTVLNVNKSVQKVIRSSLEKQKKEEKILKKALDLLFKHGLNSSSLDHATSIWDHVSKHQELIRESSGLPSHIVNALREHAKYEEADIFGWKALDLLKRTVGESHPETLTLRHNIGTLLEVRGKYKEALEILLPLFHEKDIELSKRKEIRDTLTTIARQFCELSQYGEALLIYRSLLGNQKVSEASDKTTLTAWHDYALLLSDLDKSCESLEILRKVLIRREVLGTEDDDILSTKNSIAHVLIKQSKYSEALKIFMEVFYERKRISGKDHPDTLRTRRDIGLVLQNQGKYDKALAIYEEVVENFKQVLGEEHPDTLATQANLASVLQINNKYQKALEVYQYVYKKQSETLGQQHIETLKVRYNMASIFCAQKKYDEALQAFQEVYKEFKEILGSEHQDTLKVSREIELLLVLANQLFTVVKSNDLEKTESLIKYGVVINNKDTDGWTALHYAVNNGRVDIISTLLTNGADVTQVTNKGNTPLHIAVLKDHKEIVEVLLRHISSDKLNDFINSRTTVSGTTSLHVAAKNGSLEIVKSLLKYGAIYNIENKEGKTPFNLSKDKSVTNLLKLVDELFEGAKNGNAEIISKLKATKPDECVAVINARNNQGSTLLQVAIANRYKDIASELLEMLKKPDQALQDIKIESQVRDLKL